ncbi:MAG TPA: hypothetical protein VGR47_12070 [Terracidiphilus sp.]|nr:hypothetical protein [Terracidiphilus sp.]
MMLRMGQLTTTTKPATRLLPLPGSVCYSFVLPAALGLMLFWPFGDTAKKVSMTPGKEDPAAHGTVAVKTGHNGNTQVNITTDALAQPSALTPPENTYIVWLQPDGQDARDIGSLRVDNKLHGKLNTTSPYRRFKVFITAEKQRGLTKPKGPTVLSADVLG